MKIKSLVVSTFIIALFTQCTSPEKPQKPSMSFPNLEKVISFKGQQVTGITYSPSGRLFVNFPTWRKGVKNAVMEIDTVNGQATAYPNAFWNENVQNILPDSNKFLCVQSVVAHGDLLYVLDTRNPEFKGIIDEPRIFVFDLNTDTLKHTYFMGNSVDSNSYINDIRINPAKNEAYITDSGLGGIVILDLATGENHKILAKDSSTLAETDHLTFAGKRWNGTVHADGIAFNEQTQTLYYHALSGYHLYSLPVADLTPSDSVLSKMVYEVSHTSAPDGMICGPNGNIYLADLENNAINYVTPKGELITLVQSDKIKWADTFTLHKGYLYFTNSRINEAGSDIADLEFDIYRIKL